MGCCLCSHCSSGRWKLPVLFGSHIETVKDCRVCSKHVLHACAWSVAKGQTQVPSGVRDANISILSRIPAIEPPSWCWQFRSVHKRAVPRCDVHGCLRVREVLLGRDAVEARPQRFILVVVPGQEEVDPVHVEQGFPGLACRCHWIGFGRLLLDVIGLGLGGYS